MNYHSNVKLTEEAVSFDLTNLDVSIVNGLRRVIYAEVPCVSIYEVDLKVENNVSVFNTQYIQDRLSMIPIKGEYNPNLVFKISDANGQRLKNESNDNLHVFVKDFLAFDNETPVDVNEYIAYPDMYMFTLKHGEYMLATMRTAVGIGQTHARWHSGLVSKYRFKTDKPIDSPEYWESGQYHPIRDRQEYTRADNIYGKYDTPQIFEMEIEYNGHYLPRIVWVKAIQTLKNKIRTFMTDIQSERVNIEASKEIHNLVILTIDNQDHTLGNIIASHYLYGLHELLNDAEMLESFSHYQVPHPLDDKLVVKLKMPYPERITGGYDDEYLMNHPSLRFLMITLSKVLNTLDELEKEAKTISETDYPISADADVLPHLQVKTDKEKLLEEAVIAEDYSIIGNVPKAL